MGQPRAARGPASCCPGAGLLPASGRACLWLAAGPGAGTIARIAVVQPSAGRGHRPSASKCRNVTWEGCSEGGSTLIVDYWAPPVSCSFQAKKGTERQNPVPRSGSAKCLCASGGAWSQTTVALRWRPPTGIRTAVAGWLSQIRCGRQQRRSGASERGRAPAIPRRGQPGDRMPVADGGGGADDDDNNREPKSCSICMHRRRIRCRKHDDRSHLDAAHCTK